MLLRLSWRNLMGAGLRTWLNAFVLSLAFLLIITAQGLLHGMNEQAAQALVAVSIGGGQYWHPAYDPYDPLALEDARGPLPAALQERVARGEAVAVLAVPGGIYPAGRMKPVVLKGIDPAQDLLDLPAAALDTAVAEIPLLIGARMARSSGLAVGDRVTLQWRDAGGTFDARDGLVVAVMRTPVQGVDQGQVWLPLDSLRAMTALPGAATHVTLARGTSALAGDAASTWRWRSTDDLLADVRELVRAKTAGSLFVYALLLFLAMLAVFDTQVFSIFRRQRELGTLIALGMTRRQVLGLFTLEGSLHGVLALALAVAWGTPLLAWFARRGWTLPRNTDDYGFAIGDTLYPVFGPDLLLGTALVVLGLTAFVSWLPTRRIARLQPTAALRGRAL